MDYRGFLKVKVDDATTSFHHRVKRLQRLLPTLQYPTYLNILKQLTESFEIEAALREYKTLYILIDEAHLLEMSVLRKLRLLFERFPKKHNLILFGQRELLLHLSMNVNQDIKSRITYSVNLLPLNDEDMQQ